MPGPNSTRPHPNDKLPLKWKLLLTPVFLGTGGLAALALFVWEMAGVMTRPKSWVMLGLSILLLAVLWVPGFGSLLQRPYRR